MTPNKAEETETIDSKTSEIVTDTVDLQQAEAEFQQRKQSQKALIDETGREKLLEMLYQMVLSRHFEEKCAEVYRMGKIGGFCHLYIGQEACAIGTISAIRPDDLVITSYRDHVHAIVKGMSPESVLAELYGKAGGCVGGKGGSMHMFSAEHHFYGGHGIVGGQIPVGTGMAYATKYKGTDQVTLCYFGEAAVNQGAFHESLNMARLWKLPCIYICENNQYGMGTSQARAMSLSSVAKKGDAYDIPSEFVDGMDVLAVRAATERAVKRAREESLPTLLEIRCYRYMGHSMSDPGNYRTRDEITKYQARDPIKLFSETLIENEILDEGTLAHIEKTSQEAVDRAVKFAEESPFPEEKELFSNIYA